MDDTLVYDAARDAAGGPTIMTVAVACILAGLALIALATIVAARRRPDRRGRSFVTLALVAGLAAAVVVGLRILGSASTGTAHAETIEGAVGSVSSSLLTVGGIKVAVSCAEPTHCPGVAVGDEARVAYVEDGGPETDARAMRIWKRPAAHPRSVVVVRPIAGMIGQ